MSKVQLVALKTFRYGGKLRQPGDEFETPGQTDALRLRAFKMAELPTPKFYVPDPEPVVRSYVRRDIVVAESPASEPEPASEPDADAPRPKRAYRRRDMKAED